MITEQALKQTYVTRSALDSSVRSYVYDQTAMLDMKKKFNYKTPDMKMLLFAKGEAAVTSDCFIMYAIAHMGVAAEEGILMFLRAISRLAPELSIFSCNTPDASETLHNRLLILTRNGFLFKSSYEVGDKAVSLYSLTDDSFQLVRQKLGKSLAINTWIAAKSACELIGWANASFLGGYLAQSTSFVGYLERVLRTKQIGSVFLPSELKFVTDDELYYVGVISAHLYQDKRIQTELDFRESCATKLNTIRNYLLARTKKGTAMVAIAVADNSDLDRMTNLIINSEMFDGLYDRIYFSGEGLVKTSAFTLENSFLQIVEDSDTEAGYSVLVKKPEFISNNG